jgi:iron complex outermembrane receptor protein
MKRRRLRVAAYAMVLCGTARAESEAGVTGGYFEDFPVVLSASRLVQTVDEAPAAVTVIDRDMIRASGVRDLVDLFRLVPGMVVAGHKAHEASVGFNGFTDPYFRQLQVLIDGVSVYNPAWGGAEWSELPLALEDIERIEVVRGPDAAAYGANSALGVVNIITRDPAVEHGGQVVANIGENGIRDAHMRYAVNQGDLRYRMTAGQRADEGLDSRPDSRRTDFFNLRSHYRLEGNDELRLQAGYIGGTQEDGTYPYYPTHPDGPRARHFDAGSAQLRWTRAPSTDDEFWVQFSHAERTQRDISPYTLILPAPYGTWDYPVNYSYEYRRTDIELQNTTRIGNSARGVWGAQARDEGVRSKSYFGSDSWQSSNLYRLFGNVEWRPLDGWIVSGGAMVEKTSITGTSVSPSVALNHEFVPGHTLRLRMANARRTPTLYEERMDWRYDLPSGLKAILQGLGTPLANLPLAQSGLTRDKLKDERIRSREISYLGQFPDIHINAELHLFEHRLEDLISLYQYAYPTVMGVAAGGKYAFTHGFANLDSARVRGSSAAVRWQPRPGTQLYWAGSRSVIHADGPDATGIEASGPTSTVSLLLSQDLPGNWQASCGYYRVGSMRPMSGGDPLPPAEQVNVRLAKRFQLGNSRAEVALIVRQANGDVAVFNLTDIDRRTSWLNMRIEY